MISPRDVQALAQLLQRTAMFDGEMIYAADLLVRLAQLAPPAEPETPTGPSAPAVAPTAAPTEPSAESPAPAPPTESLHEQLAALAHAQWSAWMTFLFDRATTDDDGAVTISADYARALRRQMTTAYADLSAQEQDADRTEAVVICQLLGIPAAVGEGPWPHTN